MFKIFKSRRASLALIGMFLLLVLGIHLKIDTSGAIATICLAVAGANASEGIAASLANKNQSKSSKDEPA